MQNIKTTRTISHTLMFKRLVAVISMSPNYFIAGNKPLVVVVDVQTQQESNDGHFIFVCFQSDKLSFLAEPARNASVRLTGK